MKLITKQLSFALYLIVLSLAPSLGHAETSSIIYDMKIVDGGGGPEWLIQPLVNSDGSEVDRLNQQYEKPDKFSIVDGVAHTNSRASFNEFLAAKEAGPGECVQVTIETETSFYEVSNAQCPGTGTGNPCSTGTQNRLDTTEEHSPCQPNMVQTSVTTQTSVSNLE